jgi:hypothetical protein
MSDAGTQFSDGKAYERLMGRWSRVVREIPRLAGFVERPSLARFGCGNGAFTEVIIARSAPAAVTAIVEKRRGGSGGSMPIDLNAG